MSIGENSFAHSFKPTSSHIDKADAVFAKIASSPQKQKIHYVDTAPIVSKIHNGRTVNVLVIREAYAESLGAENLAKLHKENRIVLANIHLGKFEHLKAHQKMHDDLKKYDFTHIELNKNEEPSQMIETSAKIQTMTEEEEKALSERVDELVLESLKSQAGSSESQGIQAAAPSEKLNVKLSERNKVTVADRVFLPLYTAAIAILRQLREEFRASQEKREKRQAEELDKEADENKDRAIKRQAANWELNQERIKKDNIKAEE